MIKWISSVVSDWGDSNITPATLNDCIEYCNNLEVISLDTETQGFDPHSNKLLSLQIGNKQTQFVIDCTTIDITPLKNVLESKLILIHNAKFDWKFLYHQGIDIKNIYDTFLAECILTTGYNVDSLDLSLKGTALKYCNINLDKTIRGEIHRGFSTRVINYAANDIIYLEEIRDKQILLIDKYELHKVLELENKVTRVFSKMEYDGINFDTNKLSEVISELDSINNKLIKDLDNLVIKESDKFKALKPYTQVQYDMFSDTKGTTINWSSPAQKVKILNITGLSVNSVSDKVLQANKDKNKFIPLFIEYSKFNKLSSSFGTPLLQKVNKITNRIHASIWQILQTGRISMQQPKQNWAA